MKGSVILEYIKGEYVIYNGTEICRIGEWAKRNFDGVSEKSYLTLYPDGMNTTVYVPKEKCCEMLRPVLSKNELISLIDIMCSIDSAVSDDCNNNNDADFSEAVKNGDYKTIITFMNTIYNRGLKRAGTGKSLFKTDKRKFDTAKKLIDSEFALAFGIEISEVESFIRSRISEKQAAIQ